MGSLRATDPVGETSRQGSGESERVGRAWETRETESGGSKKNEKCEESGESGGRVGGEKR